jgi:hypothetical protein
MGENEGGGDSRFMTGFLVGFIVGVLICIGVGGTFFVVSGQRSAMAERRARDRAMQAEAEARLALEQSQLMEKKSQKVKKLRDMAAAEVAQYKRAQAQVKNLELAVLKYKLDHGAFPQSLEALTEVIDGKPAYVEKKDLNDPWDRPYQYDPMQLDSTGKPLIFSHGANPADPKGQIRNWK